MPAALNLSQFALLDLSRATQQQMAILESRRFYKFIYLCRARISRPAAGDPLLGISRGPPPALFFLECHSVTFDV